MRIDRTHRPWVIATVALAIISTVAYILYAVETPGGPRGGSALGLTFGIVGYAMMLYAGLLGARKRVPTWRIGRAQNLDARPSLARIAEPAADPVSRRIRVSRTADAGADAAVLHRDRQRHSGRRHPALRARAS